MNDANQTQQFTLELEPSSDAIHGIVESPDGTREPFWGWIELMAALERAAANLRRARGR